MSIVIHGNRLVRLMLGLKLKLYFFYDDKQNDEGEQLNQIYLYSDPGPVTMNFTNKGKIHIVRFDL